MSDYLLTVQMRFAAEDDADARQMVGDLDDLSLAADVGIMFAFCPLRWDAERDQTIKLQRLYDDRPPRLLDKWPSDDGESMPAAEAQAQTEEVGNG